MKKIAIKLPKLTPWLGWLAFLCLMIASGILAGMIVFWKGLSVTNLTDLVPWGLWITIDLSSIAVSAGAFFLCAGVYLVGLKRFQPVAKTATFIGLIGYTMALLTLIMDIGRPDRFWHAIVYWNKHSLLWEVTMCVTLYLTVLIFENMPVFAQLEFLKKRFPKVVKFMNGTHHYAPYMAVVGMCLSMLHQSSLGAVYGVLKARPLWYRPDVSVLFIFSAILAGMSMTVFVSMLSARLSKKIKVDDNLLERVAYFIGWALVGYLYFRFWDALAMTYTYEPGRTEGLGLLTRGPLSFNFWVGEILLGTIVPMVLLLKKSTRSIPIWRMLAMALVVGGVVAYRWDTNLSGFLVVLSYLPGQPAITYTKYFPSLIEFMAGFGVIAYGVLAVSLGVRYLNVVDHSDIHEAKQVEEVSHDFEIAEALTASD